MKSTYAKLLSNRYKAVHGSSLPFSIRQLYLFVYPQIYMSIKKGDTSAVLNNRPPQAILDILNKDGFIIYTVDNKTTIDWSGSVNLYSLQRNAFNQS
jgi:hypothetical protein